MSHFASDVLRQVLPCPLSVAEIAEDLGFDANFGFDHDRIEEIKRTLVELQKAGQVKRFEDRDRDDGPFFGVPCSRLSAGVSPVEDYYVSRSYLHHYDNPRPD